MSLPSLNTLAYSIAARGDLYAHERIQQMPVAIQTGDNLQNRISPQNPHAEQVKAWLKGSVVVFSVPTIFDDSGNGRLRAIVTLINEFAKHQISVFCVSTERETAFKSFVKHNLPISCELSMLCDSMGDLAWSLGLLEAPQGTFGQWPVRSIALQDGNILEIAHDSAEGSKSHPLEVLNRITEIFKNQGWRQEPKKEATNNYRSFGTCAVGFTKP